jgi:hypothetical protein
VKLDVGSYNPMRGLSWGELAAESRSMHKSQGFGAPRRRGPAPEYFKVLAGDPIKASPLDGITFDWSRVRGSGKLVDVLRSVRRAFRPSAPELSTSALLEARDLLDRLPDNPWKQSKRAEIDAAIVACAGLFVEVTGGVPSVPRGGSLPVTISALARRSLPLSLESVKLPGHESSVHQRFTENQPLEIHETLAVNRDTPLTTPYWLEVPPEAGRYPVRDAAQIGLPEGPPSLEAELCLLLGGHKILVRRAVAYKWTDPVLGERYRAVEVLPAVTVDFDTQVLVFPEGRSRDLTVRVRSTGGAAGSVHLEGQGGFTATPLDAPYRVPPGGEVAVSFRVTPPSAAGTGAIRAVARVDGDPGRYERGLRRIEHDHIPPQTLLPPTELRAVRIDVVRRRHRIGYIPGAGDEVPVALRQLGYEVVTLDPKTLTMDHLRGIDSIVTGVRAWNVEPSLVLSHALLMDWVARGGTLVAQYNTNSRIGPAPPDLGPFPFVISHDRTTDENAVVTRLKDPILSSPNQILASDFDGWVQERGLYYANSWDPRYRAPLSMSDPGEKPTAGGLLVGKHGKGVFIYTGLALFRQLPAGVPGAYRLLVNLVEHGGPGS